MNGSEVLADTVFGVGGPFAGHIEVRIELVQLSFSFRSMFLSAGVAMRFCERCRSLMGDPDQRLSGCPREVGQEHEQRRRQDEKLPRII